MTTENKREGQDVSVESPETETASQAPDSVIEDAELVSETPARADDTPADGQADDATPADGQADDATPADGQADDAGKADASQPETDHADPAAPGAPASTAASTAASTSSPTPDGDRDEDGPVPVHGAGSGGTGAGVMSTVFGGALAALVGFGAAQFINVDWLDMTGLGRDPVAAALDTQTAELGSLRARLAEVEAANTGAVENLVGGQVATLSGSVDSMGTRVSETLDRLEATLGGAEDQYAAVAAALGTVEGRLSGIGDQLLSVEDRLAEVDARLVEVEKRPLVESSETARAAFEVYERELEDLRSSLQSQQQQAADMEETMTEMLATARAQMTAVQEEAQAQLQDVRNQSDDRITAIQAEAAARIAEAEASAEARAAQAVADAALAQVAAALNAGIPYAAVLPSLAAVTEVPAVLSDNAAEGIPTLLQLQEAFPPLAREALDASITATMGDDAASRFSAFLRTQTGVRSLEAREGDDPDAVLSRMGAAVEAGDLATALGEYDALPDAGQAVMAGWADDARARVAVDSALPALSASLKSK